MTATYSIPERLVFKISAAARKKGFTKPEDFLTQIIEEKLLEMEEREKVFAITEKVRAAYEAKGVSEEESLAKFESFRERLHHERIKGNHRS